jgi:hypothetical protein
MSRRIALGAALALTLIVGPAYAEDPFAAGADALAVKDSDGSSSVRAKLKLKKMTADMVMIQVKAVNDKAFPNCVVHGKVLKAAKAKKKWFKGMKRGKTYRFAAVLKKKGRSINLKHKMTQNNLGLCYYPKKSKLVLKISGIDKKARAFKASEVYLK